MSNISFTPEDVLYLEKNEAAARAFLDPQNGSATFWTLPDLHRIYRSRVDPNWGSWEDIDLLVEMLTKLYAAYDSWKGEQAKQKKAKA